LTVAQAATPIEAVRLLREVYDPGVAEIPAANANANQSQGSGLTSVTASVAFYQGDKKVFETPAVRVNRLNAKRQGVVPLGLETLLKSLPAGQYVCQVNVIDQLGHKFAFPRSSIVVLADEPAAKPAAPADPARKAG
jgi:type IV secretory pathway protease TraF